MVPPCFHLYVSTSFHYSLLTFDEKRYFIQVPKKGNTSNNATDTQMTQNQSIPLLGDSTETI